MEPSQIGIEGLGLCVVWLGGLRVEVLRVLGSGLEGFRASTGPSSPLFPPQSERKGFMAVMMEYGAPFALWCAPQSLIGFPKP